MLNTNQELIIPGVSLDIISGSSTCILPQEFLLDFSSCIQREHHWKYVVPQWPGQVMASSEMSNNCPPNSDETEEPTNSHSYTDYL